MAKTVLPEGDRAFLRQLGTQARERQLAYEQTVRDRDDAARLAMNEGGAGVGELADLLGLSRTSVERIRGAAN